jgi:GNAT superfamily N-acetyltransferase
MLTFLEFLQEASKVPSGTVIHSQEIDHPTDKGRKAYLVAAYHKDAANQEPSYTSAQITRHAANHPEGYGPEHGIGFAIFHKDNKGKIHRAYRLHTDSEWQRRGVATAMYDHAREKGLSIKPSGDQSEKGKLFWKGYRKHLKESGSIIESDNNNYLAAKKKRDELEAEVDKHAKVLQGYPTGEMGLVPDNIKSTPEFKTHKQNYNAAFQNLRNFNSSFTKTYKKEIAADRAAKLKGPKS